MGYNPSLFLGDMTGDKIEDVAVVIDTGEAAVLFMHTCLPI